MKKSVLKIKTFKFQDLMVETCSELVLDITSMILYTFCKQNCLFYIDLKYQGMLVLPALRMMNKYPNVYYNFLPTST